MLIQRVAPSRRGAINGRFGEHATPHPAVVVGSGGSAAGWLYRLRSGSSAIWQWRARCSAAAFPGRRGGRVWESGRVAQRRAPSSGLRSLLNAAAAFESRPDRGITTRAAAAAAADVDARAWDNEPPGFVAASNWLPSAQLLLALPPPPRSPRKPAPKQGEGKFLTHTNSAWHSVADWASFCSAAAAAPPPSLSPPSAGPCLSRAHNNAPKLPGLERAAVTCALANVTERAGRHTSSVRPSGTASTRPPEQQLAGIVGLIYGATACCSSVLTIGDHEFGTHRAIPFMAVLNGIAERPPDRRPKRRPRRARQSAFPLSSSLTRSLTTCLVPFA